MTYNTQHNYLNYSDTFIDILKEWSKCNTYTILFDSDINGNGELIQMNVRNKEKVFFIVFDEHCNIFGGYVNNKINNEIEFTVDENSFVFSLVRNGCINNKKYNINVGDEDVAFWLYSGSPYLFGFGIDFGNGSDCSIFTVGSNNSSCTPTSYNYDVKYPLVDFEYPFTFQTQRIIIIQMLF